MSRLPALLRRVGRWLWAVLTWRLSMAEGDTLQIDDTGHQVFAPSVSEIQVFTHTLTVEEIETLWSTGTDLLPEVANTAYWPIGGYIASHTDTPWGGGDPAAEVTVSAGPAYLKLAAAATTAIFSAPTFAPFNVISDISESLPDTVGALYISMSGSGDISGGTGTADLVVLYRTVDVPT